MKKGRLNGSDMKIAYEKCDMTHKCDVALMCHVTLLRGLYEFNHCFSPYAQGRDFSVRSLE